MKLSSTAPPHGPVQWFTFQTLTGGTGSEGGPGLVTTT